MAGECTKGTLCYNCGGTGHYAKDCEKPKKKMKCYACGGEHVLKDCTDAEAKEKHKLKRRGAKKAKKKKARRVGVKAARKLQGPAGDELVDAARIEVDLADAVATVVGGEGKRDVDVMVFCDGGCVGDGEDGLNVASQFMKTKLRDAGARITIKKVAKPYEVALAAEGTDDVAPIMVEEQMIVHEMTMDTVNGPKTLRDVVYDILPGTGRELIFGRKLLADLGVTPAKDQLFRKEKTLREKILRMRKIRSAKRY